MAISQIEIPSPTMPAGFPSTSGTCYLWTKNTQNWLRCGNFVVHKTRRNFSALALDEAHEQANAIVKADGGAIGLTENPSALRRWMVAGPEVSHLVSLYETEVQTKEAQEQTVHHEQTLQAQKTFLERVKKLSNCLQDLGNPFEEESRDLYSIDTRTRIPAEILQTHLKKGQTKAQDFAQGLQENPTTFYDPIKRNRVDFFSQETATVMPSKQKLVILQTLYILSEQRM